MLLRALVLVCVFTIAIGKESIPAVFTLGMFYPENQQKHNPRKSETLSSGAIRDVIKRNSPRYRKVLVRNSNPDVQFTTEDSHFMTSRTKSKLDVLQSLFKDKHGINVKVLLAWTDVVDKKDMLSLHYEGRALRIQSSDGKSEKLSDLAKVAIEAGFDWVYYENRNFIHISVLPDVCQTKLDLAIVVDTSGSIKIRNFRRIQAFLKRLVDYFNIGRDETHIGLISYSNLVEIEFYLNNFTKKEEVKKGIDNIWYQGSNTRTGDALMAMVNSVFNTHHGMREDQSIPKLGILMTDGYSNDGLTVKGASQKAKEAGINMFVIGITSAPRISEISIIASEPLKTHFQRIAEFTDLSTFVDRISMVSCDQGAQMSKCATTETDVEGGSFKYFRIELLADVKKITIELNDHKGMSFMYVSLTLSNPGPLSDSKDVYKSESLVSPRTISLTLNVPPTGKSNIVFIAVQGQEVDNKFALSIWDSLFPKDSGKVSIKENGTRDELVTTVRTKESSEKFHYRIKDGDPDKMFNLDEDTGILKTSEGLDREKVSAYQLSIIAIDVKEVCHKGLFVLHINVLDIDDNIPVFEMEEYQAKVRENTPSGQYVIQVKATDADIGTNAELRYYIDGPSELKNVFQINHYTGIVTTFYPLDYETKSQYTLKLRVKDMGPLLKSGYTTLVISIIDVNEPPYFTSPQCIKNSSCEFKIFEEKPAGTNVGIVAASDPDIKVQCQLTYNIISQDRAYFTIGKTSGIITTKKRLDREVKENYVVEIEVSDCGNPKLSEKRKALIKLLDINDNSPKFPYPSYIIHVREDLNVSSILPLKIHATDADAGTNAQIHYGINQTDYLTIDKTNGNLTLVKELDRETRAKITFTVTAIDGGQPARTTAVFVTIIVTDVNDNAPVFVGERVYNIVENVEAGRLVFVANATDADEGLNAKIRFSMLHGDPMFSIDIAGNVRNTGSPDREKVDTYTLTIMAQDLGSPSLSNKTDYTIKVLDMNDNAPKCDKSPYMKTVKQNISVNTKIVKVQASDPDLGKNGTFSFHIKGGNDKFIINQLTGLIQLKDVLNYTKKSFYQLKIRVPDNGIEQLTGDCSVDIKVEDTNDHTPMFSYRKYNASLKENIPLRTEVLKVTATDGDSGTSGKIIYSITKQTPAAHFSIDSKIGQIFTIHAIDYEKHKEYNLTVKAADKGSPSRSSLSTVHISILDLNDNIPFMKTFTTSIPEDIHIGKEIGRVTATDQDSGTNGEVWFQLASINFPFKVASNGSVTVSKSLDRETVDFYNLRINASDKGYPTLSTTGLNAIRITDVNDNNPIFTKLHYECTVVENSINNTYVCDVKATDKDIGENARLSYFIHWNEFFKIHEATGQVSVLHPIDRETVPQVTVKVNASDHGSPSLSGKAQLVVKVLDVNDNIPHCSKSSYSFTLVEEKPHGTLVGQIAATDKDEGSNAEITFKLVEGHIFNSKARFFLTQENNNAKLYAYTLDYEEHNHYVITVRVTDHGRPSLSSQCTVDVKLIDINDNSPVLSQYTFKRSIKENVGIGTYVLKVAATDKDSGSNGELSYKILSGKKQDHFKLNVTTGVLSTAKVLDYDTTAKYEFKVEVSDNGNPRRKVTAFVVLKIIKVDHIPPKFEKVQEVSLYEDVAVGQPIMQFNATGADGRKLTFSIVAGNEEDKFKIDKSAGLLTLKHSLDRETTDFYNVTVSASDLRKAVNASLPVKVLDVNDNAPKFSNSSYSTKFPENQYGDVIKIYATDRDIGSNAEIEFAIISGDNNAEFLIDKKSGIIKVRKTLDRETKSKYVLKVEAADKGKPVLKSDILVTIVVQDVNDNAPKFDRLSYSVAIAENTGVSYTILSISATDIDAGNNGTVGYRIKKDYSNAFQINLTSGEIKTKVNLDRETKDKYELIIEAYDFGTPKSLANSVTVRINVTDVNDNHPVIISPKTLKACNESVPVNTKLQIIKATDRDIGTNAELVYSITNQGNKQMFKIDSHTGQIYLQSALDAEKQQSYVVMVTVADKGSPSLSISKDYQLNVLDANDNAPVFTASNYQGSIEENKEGKTNLFTVNATDADVTAINSDIKYSLVTNDTTGLFEVEPHSGVVSVTRQLDYEKVRLYKFSVKAMDWKFSVQVPVEIKVINLNDNNPIFPTKQYNITIQENLNIGTYVLTVGATDLDSFGDLHYNLVFTDKSLPFTIDSKSGVITVGGELDRETTPWFYFEVCAKDNGVPVLNGTAYVNITLSDMNDNHPLFKSYSKTVKIQENQKAGSVLSTITATDKDIGLNGKIKYESKPNGNFHIDPDNGRITTKRPFDREVTTFLEFHVVAIDYGTPPLKSDEFFLKVIIGDENDNSPLWLQPYYSVSVLEDAVIGYEFIDATATDPDLNENGTVIYQIVHHQMSHFKIQSDSGVVSVLHGLDRETVDYYNVTLIAHDNGTSPRSTKCQLYINITDVNDNAPIINTRSLHGQIYENQPKGTKVVKVTATDRDIGTNAELVYELKGAGSDLFHIDSSSGQVETMLPLDREEKDRYLLHLVVSDRGVPQLKSTAIINITILDLDDNCPIFYAAIYTASIVENSPYGYPVLNVSATDADIGTNAILNYGILNSDGGGVFNVDPNTGEVSVAGEVDREFKEIYHLQIRAGTPFCGQKRNESEEGEKPLVPHYAFTNVYITALDVNDNAPIFLNGKENIVFDQLNTSELYRLNATDPDLGKGGEVEFRLKSVMQATDDKYIENHVTVEAFDHGEVSQVSNQTLIVVNHIRCDAMHFFVSAAGIVTVDSLCAVNNTKKDLQLQVGGSAYLRCIASGNTKTKYRWIKDGDVVSVWSKDGGYVLSDVHQGEEGYYACVASSNAGSIQSSSTTVIVKEGPKVIQEPADVMVDLGGVASLKVVAVGDPEPKYQWYRNGIKVRAWNPSATHSELIINTTILDDTASYSCKIENEVNSSWTRSAKLTIVNHADVVSLKVEINRPDADGKCQIFSPIEFQRSASEVLDKAIVITEFSPYNNHIKFCNVTVCTDNPCINGGKCVVAESGYQCVCKSTWTGKNCENDLDECAFVNKICYGKNSKCSNLNGSFSCECSHGLIGHRCEYKKDACIHNKCNPAQEICVPSEEREHACVSKHNLVNVVYDSSITSLTTQKKYEIVDQLNQVIKSQSPLHTTMFKDSFDFGICTFHVINGAPANPYKSSPPNIYLAVDCPVNQTSINLTSSMISDLCTLLFPNDDRLSECGEPGSTRKPIAAKLDPASAEIHLIIEYDGSILSADESIDVMKSKHFDRAIQGVAVRDYDHAYRSGKQTGGKSGSSSTTIVIAVVGAIIVILVIVGILRFAKGPKLSMLTRSHKESYAVFGKSVDLINPAYDDNASEDGCNFTYDMPLNNLNNTGE